MPVDLPLLRNDCGEYVTTDGRKVSTPHCACAYVIVSFSTYFGGMLRICQQILFAFIIVA